MVGKQLCILIFSRENRLVEKLGQQSFTRMYLLSLTTCQKSLEEEKKQHVEKAKELQKWVSNISKTMRDGEKAGKPLFSNQQVFTEVLMLNFLNLTVYKAQSRNCIISLSPRVTSFYNDDPRGWAMR